jgi:hypothetical protein
VKQSPPAEPHAKACIHTCDGMLPRAPKGPFATLLSPPQCYAAFGRMPHTLASVDHSPVCCTRTLPHPLLGSLGLDFWGTRTPYLHEYIKIREYKTPDKVLRCTTHIFRITVAVLVLQPWTSRALKSRVRFHLETHVGYVCLRFPVCVKAFRWADAPYTATYEMSKKDLVSGVNSESQ